MFTLFTNKPYRHLFLAQVIALLGTGLLTVALGLLAFDLAGEDAGLVLGTAFAIKMLAYVGIAPIAGALAGQLPRRGFLVFLDLVRAGIALSLPFVSEIWQIFALIFILQAASAAFTPTFQATIPDILPDEKDYTRALSLSRLAYDLESLLSPVIAAGLLALMSFHSLFAGTAIGFVLSGLLVITVTLPPPVLQKAKGLYRQTFQGIRIYLATPRLRGLLLTSLAVASSGAMVLVNTVVLVQGRMELGQQETALALAAFGGGSMFAALLLPKLLENYADRTVMLAGAGLLILCTPLTALVPDYPLLLLLWCLLGISFSTAQTPAGRLLKRSSHAEDRPAVYAAQFALSHACWLIAYPLAGLGGAELDLLPTALILTAIGMTGFILALFLWPSRDPEQITHSHDDLPPDHPHLKDGGGHIHSHAYVIDDLHAYWPKP